MAKASSASLPAGLPDLPGLFPSILQGTFQELDIGVSTCTDNAWRALYLSPVMTTVELEQGLSPLRYRYNLRCLREARRTRKIVHGELFGLHDLFVPIVKNDQVRTVLVTGPFATSRPTSAEILDRWYSMTRAHGRITDPAFMRYLTFTLGTLTLEGSFFGTFERFMGCFAHLVGGTEEPKQTIVEAQRMHEILVEARQVDRMWSAAWSMVDERTAHTWLTGLQRDPMAGVGLARAPRHAWVGLLVGRGTTDDPVGELVARDAVQRAMVAFARARRHVASGRVGDRGFTLLSDSTETGVRAKAVLTDLSLAVTPIARRFGFELHVGIGLAQKSMALPTCYRAALAAAEKALTRGTSLEYAEPRTDGSLQELRHQRASLGDGVEEHPSHLSARFERYLGTVLSQTGYRADAARWHLQAGLERLAEPLLGSGALERRSFDEICDGVDSIGEVESVAELALHCRRLVADIERAIEAPTQARRGRNLRRAIRFIHEHLPEPLTLTRVARVAGFAPDYFSTLLKEEEGTTFEQYVQRHRLERAKHLLSGTSMSIGRVAYLSGFRSRTYFQRLFKQSTNETPKEYRRI